MDNDSTSDDVAVVMGWVKAISIFIGLAIILWAVWDSRQEIPTGHIGLKTSYSAVTGDVLNPGLHWVIPGVQGVVDFDTRQQSYDTSGQFTSYDQQLMTTQATVIYQVLPKDVPALYASLGTSYADKSIVPNTATALSDTIGHYKAEQFSTSKLAVVTYFKNAVQASMKADNYPINIVSVKIITSYPEGYQQAIEDKQTAQQRVLTAEQTLAQKRIDAQQQVVEAQNKAAAQIAEANGNAQATLINAKAAAAAQKLQAVTLNPLYVQLQGILHWNGILPQYNSVPIPFLQVGK